MPRPNSFRTSAFLLSGALLGAVACGGDDDSDHTADEHALEEEFCEHLTGGPFQDVASSTTTDGAPSARFEHTAVKIALTGGAGFVTFEADEATDFAVALSSKVPFGVTQGGAEKEIENSEEPTDAPCTELAVVHTVELEVGTAIFEFGPSSETEVSMVVEEAAHGDEHDHSHGEE